MELVVVYIIQLQWHVYIFDVELEASGVRSLDTEQLHSTSPGLTRVR